MLLNEEVIWYVNYISIKLRVFKRFIEDIDSCTWGG